MTTTHIYQGMDKDSKPSSRVLAPPGGGSSNIFGSEPSAQVKQTPKQQPPKPEPTPVKEEVQQDNQQRNIRSAPKQAFNPITGEPYGAPPAAAAAKTDTTVTSQNQAQHQEKSSNEETASSGQDNSQKSQPPSNAEPREHTSTRILNPPGGKSSKLW